MKLCGISEKFSWNPEDPQTHWCSKFLNTRMCSFTDTMCSNSQATW